MALGLNMHPPYKSPNEMNVKELREALEPYGTMHRLTMRKAQLVEALMQIQRNEREFGAPNRPLGFFRDEHKNNCVICRTVKEP